MKKKRKTTTKKKKTTAHNTSKEPKPLTPKEQLDAILATGTSPDQLSVLHDQLKLLGVVMGQRVLLQSLFDPAADVKDKVSAAKTLVGIPKEKPEELSDRLRGSVFSGLSVDQLEAIIEKVGVGNTPDKLSKLDLEQLIHDMKEK